MTHLVDSRQRGSFESTKQETRIQINENEGKIASATAGIRSELKRITKGQQEQLNQQIQSAREKLDRLAEDTRVKIGQAQNEILNKIQQTQNVTLAQATEVDETNRKLMKEVMNNLLNDYKQRLESYTTGFENRFTDGPWGGSGLPSPPPRTTAPHAAAVIARTPASQSRPARAKADTGRMGIAIA